MGGSIPNDPTVYQVVGGSFPKTITLWLGMRKAATLFLHREEESLQTHDTIVKMRGVEVYDSIGLSVVVNERMAYIQKGRLRARKIARFTFQKEEKEESHHEAV